MERRRRILPEISETEGRTVQVQALAFFLSFHLSADFGREDVTRAMIADRNVPGTISLLDYLYSLAGKNVSVAWSDLHDSAIFQCPEGDKGRWGKSDILLIIQDYMLRLSCA